MQENGVGNDRKNLVKILSPMLKKIDFQTIRMTPNKVSRMRILIGSQGSTFQKGTDLPVH